MISQVQYIDNTVIIESAPQTKLCSWLSPSIL